MFFMINLGQSHKGGNLLNPNLVLFPFTSKSCAVVRIFLSCVLGNAKELGHNLFPMIELSPPERREAKLSQVQVNLATSRFSQLFLGTLNNFILNWTFLPFLLSEIILNYWTVRVCHYATVASGS